MRRLDPTPNCTPQPRPNSAIVTAGIGDGFKHGFDVRLKPIRWRFLAARAPEARQRRIGDQLYVQLKPVPQR